MTHPHRRNSNLADDGWLLNEVHRPCNGLPIEPAGPTGLGAQIVKLNCFSVSISMFFSKICLSYVFSLFAQQRLTFVLHIAQQIFLTFVSTQKLTDAWIAIFVVRDMSTMKIAAH